MAREQIRGKLIPHPYFHRIQALDTSLSILRFRISAIVGILHLALIILRNHINEPRQEAIRLVLDQAWARLGRDPWVAVVLYCNFAQAAAP